MKDNTPAANESSGMTIEQINELSEENQRLKEKLRELQDEHEELRQEFLSKMREDVRQDRIGGNK